jgi:quinoprotein dehydrogenase-associated probable ABC transporter substrate-binding protein
VTSRGTLIAALAAGAALAPLLLPAAAQRIDLVDRTALRVCADPANLPFSNERGEGFENRIAELVAGQLKLPVEYTWFPQATGFVRRTLFARRCDVVMGYAQGDEMVLNTNHYYRSAYALVYRNGTALADLDSLADPRLADRRLGVVAGTPPAAVMARLGLIVRAKPYPLMVDRRWESPGEAMIADIRSGEIDAGVLWGPMAGYFAARGGEPLAVAPLLKENGGPPMAYRITFGVRPQDDDWKRRLNAIIAGRQGEMDAVLLDYGVPLLDEQSHRITQPRR